MTKYLVEVNVHPDQGPPFTASDMHGVVDNALGGFGTVTVTEASTTSVNDFVSCEESDTLAGTWWVRVWTEDGESITVVKNLSRAVCERITEDIKRALRTWEGWA